MGALAISRSIVLFVVAVAVRAPVAPQGVISSISSCERLKDGARILDVATQSMVVGETCSDTACC